jgi:Flp pilus assembly protein TadD
LRFLANSKFSKDQLFYNKQLQEYTQVLGNNHQFLANLSILDLLFNEGTNAVTYLENQKLDFLI